MDSSFLSTGVFFLMSLAWITTAKTTASITSFNIIAPFWWIITVFSETNNDFTSAWIQGRFYIHLRRMIGFIVFRMRSRDIFLENQMTHIHIITSYCRKPLPTDKQVLFTVLESLPMSYLS